MQKVILCDIDGTIALRGDRSPYEWAKVCLDSRNEAVYQILRLFNSPHSVFEIIMISGRDEVCRKETIKWLYDNGIRFKELYMRPKADVRKDSVIKQEIYDNYIKGKYDVSFVLDDRQQVVDMWRANGLTCLQVDKGDF